MKPKSMSERKKEVRLAIEQQNRRKIAEMMRTGKWGRQDTSPRSQEESFARTA